MFLVFENHSIKIQIGIKNVVNNIKKIEIPSTPMKKLRLNKINNSSHSTNWN